MSTKDFEYVKSLDRKGLEDYYMCYHHHRHHRHNRMSCHSASMLTGRSSRDLSSCPSVCQQEHFCTVRNNASNSFAADNNNNDDDGSINAIKSSILVCEHFKPSYTSKKDQLDRIKQNLSELKRSKSMMREVMREIDNLLAESAGSDEHLNDVQKFYASNKFIGSELNIKALRTPPQPTHSRPVSAAKYIHEINELKKKNPIEYPHGNAIFTYYSPNKKFVVKNKEKRFSETSLSSPMVICRIK